MKGPSYFSVYLRFGTLSIRQALVQACQSLDGVPDNGDWQWASSIGCDAQPNFRIFNPITQSQRFDLKGAFIRRYLPQLAKRSDKSIHARWQALPIELEAAGIKLGGNYSYPLIDPAIARQDTLARYADEKD